MLVLETRPGVLVPVTIWKPLDVGSDRIDTHRSVPVVLLATGHEPLGFRAPVEQEVLMNLVLNLRLVAVAFDPLCQGERPQFGRDSDSRHNFSVAECSFDPQTCEAIHLPCTPAHDVFGEQMFLLGASLAAYFVYDAIRILDFIETLDFVDASRIAMMGTSGGGMLTAYVGALDDRINVSVISSWMGSWRTQIRSMVCHYDAEQIWWKGLWPLGLDKVDLLIARAPLPTMIANGVRDGCASARDAQIALEDASAALSALQGQVAVSLTEGAHGWHASQLENAYSFLATHLGLETQPSLHAHFEPLPCSALSFRSGGQDMLQFPDGVPNTMPDVVAELWSDALRSLAERRRVWSGGGAEARSEIPAKVREAIGLDTLGAEEVTNWSCASCSVPDIGDTWMPEGLNVRRSVLVVEHVGACMPTIKFYQPSGVTPSRVVVAVGGSSYLPEEPSPVERLLVQEACARGVAVALVGLCGFGGSFNAATAHFAPLLVGKSHAGVMAGGLLRAVDVLRHLVSSYVATPMSIFSFGDTAALLVPEPQILAAIDILVVFDSAVGLRAYRRT